MVLAFGISSILCAVKKHPKGVFACYVLFILITSAFGTKLFYNMDYKFGQNDLMRFAKYAHENGKKVAVINDERKYSVVYYYGIPTDMDSRNILFITLNDKEEMKQLDVYKRQILPLVFAIWVTLCVPLSAFQSTL